MLLSRHGKEILCPAWFVEELPKDISLDGELWLGHGTLELLNGLLNSKESGVSWKSIFFITFDFPSSNNPYELRMRDMANLNLPSHVSVVNVEKCRGKDHIQARLAAMLEKGGEGLMANKPNSLYIASRTDRLLKVKAWFYKVNLTCHSRTVTLKCNCWK
jgi:DNA ligase-1